MGKKLFKFITSISTTFLKVALAIYIGFLLVKAMRVNIDISHQIASEKSQIKQLENDIALMQELLAYYQTPSFLELEARKELNYKLPDEKVIILPTPELKTTDVTEAKGIVAGAQTESKKTNWRLWLDYHFGK